jgi:hypothetical protein
MDENLLKDLFRRPDGRPFRRPRFGASTPPTGALPAGGAEHFLDAPPPPPFDMQLDLPDLGLTVRASEREGDRAGELWATVRSTEPAHAGREVSVALVGADDRVRRVGVAIGSERRPTGWYGEARLGPLDEIREELGGEVTLSAFLLD